MPQDPELFALLPGGRVTIAGRTGSGKSTLALRFLEASPYHWLIFNPKWSRLWDRLRPETLSRIDEGRIVRSLKRHQYTVLNFGPAWGWQEQDDLLLWTIERYENIGVCIDELYKLHGSGRAGPGLDGLLTRGRELRQSYLGLTQRPRFIALFCLTEADRVIEFELPLLDDRKRVYEATGDKAALTRLRGHDFLVFDVYNPRPLLYRVAG